MRSSQKTKANRAAPLKQSEYPKYFKTEHSLLAFMGPDKMFKVENIGSNKNPGITIDKYITRNMVLKHWPSPFHEISKEEFKKTVQRLYSAVIEHMTA